MDERQLIQAAYRYAVSLTHDSHDAEDLIQTACLKVLRAKGKLVGKSYLYVTVRSVFIDRQRSKSSRKDVDIPEDVLTDPTADHVANLDRKMDMEQLLGCLRPVEREALFLNCVEGYTADEIAQLTDQPRGTVLSHLSRAKKKLQRRRSAGDMLGTK